MKTSKITCYQVPNMPGENDTYWVIEHDGDVKQMTDTFPEALDFINELIGALS